MSETGLGYKKLPVSFSLVHASEDEQAELGVIPNKAEDSRPQDPLLTPRPLQSPLDGKALSSASSSPLESSFFDHAVDEEKQAGRPKKKKKRSLEQKKGLLDVVQRICSLIISIITFVVMAHAYVVFRANKDVTKGGTPIYPNSMQLWPTYMMIAAGAIEIALNLVIVIWRIHGTVHDLFLISTSQKYWDYVLHGINFVIWLATSTSFKVTSWSPAADPNALWGYTCTSNATELSKHYSHIPRFSVQCEVQTVSFWMGVSAVITEGITIITKFFFR